MNSGLLLEQGCTEHSSLWLTYCASPPVPCFPSGWAFGPFRRGGISGDAGVRSRARLQQRRCRQSDLPGTPRRIRATSAGTGRGATWGDVSYSGFTSQGSPHRNMSMALENHGNTRGWRGVTTQQIMKQFKNTNTPKYLTKIWTIL